MMPDRGAEPGTLKMYIPQMVSEGGLFFATPYPTDAGLSVARCLRSASGSDACVAVVEAGSKLAFLNSTDGLKYYREAATGNIFLRIINPASICFEYEQVYILKNMPESDLDWYYYAITSNKTSREDVTMSLPDADWAYDSRITYEYNQYAGGKHASQRPDNAAWEVWGASAQGPVPTSVATPVPTPLETPVPTEPSPLSTTSTPMSSPTIAPSAPPTTMSSPAPSSLTPAPTATKPSPALSQMPTLTPVPAPTHAFSNAPTPVPTTAAPTPVPTPAPTRTPILEVQVNIDGIHCGDFNQSVFNRALDYLVGNATFSDSV